MRDCTYESLRMKEVVDADDGRKLGYICDLDICLANGSIEKIVLPPPGKWFNPFCSKNRLHIPWDSIIKIGDDIILVKCGGIKVKNCP